MPADGAISDGTLARVLALHSDYGRFIDSRRLVAWSELFSEDGMLAVGGREIKGRDALAAFAEGLAPGVHVQAVPHVNPRDDGGIDAAASFVFVRAATGALLAGQYTDQLALENGRCVFVRRQIDILAQTERT